jgi:hypothetical protein
MKDMGKKKWIYLQYMTYVFTQYVLIIFGVN